MQHATCDRAIRFMSLSRALLLGCGLVLWTSVASAQLSSRDPFPPSAGSDSPSQGLKLPHTQRSKPAKLSLESEEQAPDTPFTLDEPMTYVRIEGNTTIPNQEIAKHIKTRPGRPVTQKQIKDDVDALVRTRWFASVEPSIRRTDDGNILVFRVLERPIVRKVEYRGNKKIKTKVFDNMTQLKPGQPYDVSVNRECARRIQEHYKEKGFPFATVELERGDVRSDPDREVIFIINEGPKVKVSKVAFEGNRAFSDQLLKTKTRTKTRILYYFGGKYDPSSINDDIEGIRDYYHSLGYFDVKINPHEKFSADKSTVELHYDIEEGVRYRINEIAYVGNSVLTDEAIRALIKVKPGEEYNERHITKDREAVMNKYGEQGRIFASVTPIRRWTEEPGILDLVYKINEDKVYRIRNMNIHVAGDYPHTRNNLVRNISPLHPGDLADPKKIQMMKQRLAGSQYFEADQQNGPRIETSIVKDRDWLKGPSVDVARGQSSPAEQQPVNKQFVNKQPIEAGHSIFSDADEPSPPTRSAPARTTPPRTAPKPRSTPIVPTIVPSTAPATKSNDEEAREPYLLEYKSVDEHSAVKDDGLSPITPIFRAQSKDPLKPPANFIYDVSPQGDPFGKAINNPDPYDFERVPPIEPPEFIDIDTYLSEARTGRVMFGVGVNSSSGLVGNIVLSEQNFSIMNPPKSWDDVWNGTAWRGNGEKFRIEAMPGTQLSRYVVDWTNPYFMDTNNSLGLSGFYFNRYYLNWTEQREGGRVRVGRQLSQRWSASASLRLEGVDVFNPSTPTPPPILKEALGTHLLSTVQGSIAHDNRDNAFAPSSGHHVELSLEQAYGQYNYSRMDLEARQYFTLYQRPDGGGKHTLSVRGEVGWTGAETPIFERFYAGGFQSFRGFYFRGVSPYQQSVYIGGDFMMLGSVEYMLPVLANEMVKVVTFSDFGTVNSNVAINNFRMSVGAGLRVTIPMMGPTPIALDWAVPIFRDPDDKLQTFSFYIGASR